MSDAQAVAQDQLRSLVERIMRLKDEEDGIKADVRDVYAEAKSNGFDKTALGALVAELRKRGKDASKFDETQTILDLYREAYHARAPHTHEGA